MKNFSVPLILSLIGCASTDSALIVFGKIQDRSGNPLESVKVNITGWELETDASGFFCHDGLHLKEPIVSSVIVDNEEKLAETLEYGDYELIVTIDTSEDAKISQVLSTRLDTKAAHSIDNYCWFLGVQY